LEASFEMYCVDKQDEVSSLLPDTEEVVAKIDPRIRSVYNGVKVILRNYRTGKLPKAFKVMYKTF